MFQGTVGRRNTKLRNESVILCLYISLSCERRSYAQPGGFALITLTEKP